jgi:hypothetical protein
LYPSPVVGRTPGSAAAPQKDFMTVTASATIFWLLILVFLGPEKRNTETSVHPNHSNYEILPDPSETTEALSKE